MPEKKPNWGSHMILNPGGSDLKLKYVLIHSWWGWFTSAVNDPLDSGTLNRAYSNSPSRRLWCSASGRVTSFGKWRTTTEDLWDGPCAILSDHSFVWNSIWLNLCLHSEESFCVHFVGWRRATINGWSLLTLNWCPRWTIINSLFCRARRGGGGEESGGLLFCICSSSKVGSLHPLSSMSTPSCAEPHAPQHQFWHRSLKTLWLAVAALSAFSSCLLPPRWEWERWECCSFRDAPSPGSSPVWLVPLPPRAELVSTTEHWLLHCPDKRDPAALFTLLAFQYFQFIPFALTNLKNISFSLFSFFLTHNGFENKIIRSMNPTPI